MRFAIVTVKTNKVLKSLTLKPFVSATIFQGGGGCSGMTCATYTNLFPEACDTVNTHQMYFN
jgi:hypothetical protein